MVTEPMRAIRYICVTNSGIAKRLITLHCFHFFYSDITDFLSTFRINLVEYQDGRLID